MRVSSCLKQMHASPRVVEGLLAFQITGSPIPALIALARPPFGRLALLFGDRHHA